MAAAMEPVLSYGSGPWERLFINVKRFFKSITIEPVVFLYSLGFSITIIVSPNLYFEKTCLVGSVIFGNGSSFGDEVCDNIDDGTHNTTQEYVQKTYASIRLVTMFVKGVPPIIFALFIGPWSDRFGRKFLIVFPIIGYVLYDLWFLVNVIFYYEMPVEFLMLEVVQFWFGGFMCLFLGLYSYMSDISDEKTRTVRIAVVDFVFFTGMAIGAGVSAEIYTRFGYEAIYGSACILQCLAIAYAMLFVKDSHHINKERLLSHSSSASSNLSSEDANKPTENKEKFSCLTIFNLHHIKESFGVAFRKRNGGVRHVVIILISLFGLYGFANNGIIDINIQYARAKFKWDNSDTFNKYWATLQSIGTVFNLFAIGVLMPIMTQILKLRDLSITALCVSSSIAGITTILFAHNPALLYLANFLRMFSDVVTVGIRSALTKIVGEKDVGKVFACVGAIQALVGLVSPVYQFIYRATYEWHLGFVYCISCSVLTLMFFLTIYVYVFMKRNEKKAKAAKGQVAQDQADAIVKPTFKKLDPSALESNEKY